MLYYSHIQKKLHEQTLQRKVGCDTKNVKMFLLEVLKCWMCFLLLEQVVKKTKQQHIFGHFTRHRVQTKWREFSPHIICTDVWLLVQFVLISEVRKELWFFLFFPFVCGFFLFPLYFCRKIHASHWPNLHHAWQILIYLCTLVSFSWLCMQLHCLKFTWCCETHL